MYLAVIEIFFHLPSLPGWQPALCHSVQRMRQSGLWQAAAQVHVHTHYDAHSFDPWPAQCDHPGLSVQHISHSVPPLGEVYSVCALSDHVRTVCEPRWILRYHLKGITKAGTAAAAVAQQWRDYYDHWCVDHWRLCVQALEHGYHTVGANWHHNPGVTAAQGHWSGNIWWARSDYLAQLPQLALPHTVCGASQLGGYQPRHDAELWIGTHPEPIRRLELHHHQHGCVYNVDPPTNYQQEVPQ